MMILQQMLKMDREYNPPSKQCPITQIMCFCGKEEFKDCLQIKQNMYKNDRCKKEI